MRRTYIAAIIALLALGVVSTYALAGLGQQTLTESVTTEYVVKYSGTAEVVSTTTTSSDTDTHVKLKIDITQSSAHRVQFDITPCSDYNGLTEITSSGGGDYTVKIVYTGTQADTTASATDVTSGQGLGLTITSATTTDLIDYVEVEWTDTGFYSAYWSANILAEDV